MNEMPLVIFTVFSQLAVGAIVTLWILDITNKKLKLETGKFITGSLIIITALSLGVSLLHLGHPFNAYRALTHIGSSWLSREVLFFSLFLLAEIIYFTQWKEGNESSRKKIGTLASVLAVIAVISSGMIYVLPSMPAWNNFSPLVFFTLTAALLGPLYVGVILMLKENQELNNLPIIIATVIGLNVLVFFMYLSVISSGSANQNMTGINMVASSAFWFRIILSWIIPFGMFVTAIYRKQKYNLNYLLITLFLIFIGELLGRELFYSSIVGLQINGLF